MKSQVLADFLIEYTWAEEPPEELGVSPSAIPFKVMEKEWILHVDGASNSQESGAGLKLACPKGMVVEYALQFLFPATNNQAKYEALVAKMRLTWELKVEYLRAFTDSQLISEQIAGEYEARDATISHYLSKVRSQASLFTHFSINYIPRDKNTRADALSRLVTSADGTLGRTYVEHLKIPSIEAIGEVLPIDQEPAWTEAYVRYFTDNTLSKDLAEAKLLRRRAPKLLMLDGRLYRRSFSNLLL